MSLFSLPFKSRHPLGPGAIQAMSQDTSDNLHLGNTPPGSQVKVTGFAPGISAERQAHLQAYGVIPGAWVRVVQHSPVTIIQVEHLELALEHDLARLVRIKPS